MIQAPATKANVAYEKLPLPNPKVERKGWWLNKCQHAPNSIPPNESDGHGLLQRTMILPPIAESWKKGSLTSWRSALNSDSNHILWHRQSVEMSLIICQLQKFKRTQLGTRHYASRLLKKNMHSLSAMESLFCIGHQVLLNKALMFLPIKDKIVDY